MRTKIFSVAVIYALIIQNLALAVPPFRTDNATIKNTLTLSGLTASKVPYLDASKNLATSAVTPTELGYLTGATSAIQTQLNLKAPLASPTFTGTVTAPTFAGALTGNASTATSATTATTAGNVSGTVAIGNGGTGQTTANAALNALLPSQTSNAAKALITDGTNTSWGTVASSGGSGAANYLTNSGFEAGTGSWSYNAVSTASEVTNFIEGVKSLKLSYAAQSGSAVQAVSTAVQYYGTNMEASCWIKTSLTTIQVCSLSGGNEQQCVDAPGDSKWHQVISTLIGPDNGSGSNAGIKIKSTASTTGDVYVDDCYVGTNRNISQMSQAQFMGAMVISGCAGVWSTTGGAYGNPSAQTGCTYTASGSASAPATMLPAIKFASLPAGEYVMQAESAFEASATAGASSAVAGFFKFWDGTNFAREDSEVLTQASGSAAGITTISPGISQSISYAAPQTNVTLSILMKAAGVNASAIIGQPLVIKVYRFPTSSETVVRNRPTLPTIQKFLTGSGTYTTPVGVSYIRVRMVGGGGGGAGSSNNASAGAGGNGSASTFGASLLSAGGGTGAAPGSAPGGLGGTSSLGTGPIGIAIQGGRGGGSSITGTTDFYNPGGIGGASALGGAGSGSTATTGVAGAANTGGGGGGAGSNTLTGLNWTGAGGGSGGYVDAIITSPASTYAYSVAVQDATHGQGGTAGTNGFAGGAGGSGQIVVEEYYGAMNQPLLVNSVITSSAGVERIERMHFTGAASDTTACTSNPCTIQRQSGGFSTVARNSAGNYDVAFTSSTLFSSKPVCTCSTGITTHYTACGLVYTNFPTSVRVYVGYQNGTTATTDDDTVDITCVGPK